MYSKLVATGADKHPLYATLTAAKPETEDRAGMEDMLRGYKIEPTAAPEVVWNFEKFLIGRDGTILRRFAPDTAPTPTSWWPPSRPPSPPDPPVRRRLPPASPPPGWAHRPEAPLARGRPACPCAEIVNHCQDRTCRPLMPGRVPVAHHPPIPPETRDADHPRACRCQPPSTQPNPTNFAITLMEHLVVPTFVLDADQRVLIWNRAANASPASRPTKSSARGTTGVFYDHPRPCLADLLARNDWSLIDKLYTTHDEPNTPAHGVQTPKTGAPCPAGGKHLYLVVDAGPVFDDAGKLIAVVETLRDNTENKLTQIRVAEQASLLQHHYDEHEREARMARRILDHQIRTDLIRQASIHYT